MWARTHSGGQGDKILKNSKLIIIRAPCRWIIAVFCWRSSAAAQTNFESVAKRGPGPKGALKSFNAAAAVYSGTPDTDRGLRDILVNATNNHIHEVIDKDEGNQRILRDVPELAHDLVRIRASRPTTQHEIQFFYACPCCQSTFGLGKAGKGSILQTSVVCPFCSSSFSIERYRQHFKDKFP